MARRQAVGTGGSSRIGDDSLIVYIVRKIAL